MIELGEVVFGSSEQFETLRWIATLVSLARDDEATIIDIVKKYKV